MKYIFRSVISGGLIVSFCIPLILIFEHFNISESAVHKTQLFATVSCFLSSLIYIFAYRKSSKLRNIIFVYIAILGSGLWLAFWLYVVSTLDFSGID